MTGIRVRTVHLDLPSAHVGVGVNAARDGAVVVVAEPVQRLRQALTLPAHSSAHAGQTLSSWPAEEQQRFHSVGCVEVTSSKIGSPSLLKLQFTASCASLM